MPSPRNDPSPFSVPVPAFAAPPPPPELPNDPPPEQPSQPLDNLPPAAPVGIEPTPRRPGRLRMSLSRLREAVAPTRTVTSSADGLPELDPEGAAHLIAGLIGLAFGAVALALRWRGRALRRPSDEELHDIGAPTARIVLRRLELATYGPDLADIILAGSATGAYLTRGPLTAPIQPDPGVPPDLNQEI